MTVELLKRKLKIAYWIIGVLLVATLLSVYLNMKQDGVFGLIPPFHDPVENADARDYIKKHRNSLVFRTQTDCITYDTADIRHYLNNEFGKITASHPMDPVQYKNFKLKLGFYPMHRYDGDGNRRLDFLVVPTFCSTDDQQYFDFFDSTGNPKKRLTSIKAMSKLTCTNCDGYDAGHLWP